MECLDANAVQDLMSGALDASTRADAVKHLDGCDDCRGLVSLLAKDATRDAALSTLHGDSREKLALQKTESPTLIAQLAKAHGIPFYVAAPSSTFDLTLETGAGIPIEERKSDEITHGFGRQTAPTGVQVYNPAFDVTPADLIAGIITERGVIAPVTRERVAAMVGGGEDLGSRS